MVRIFLLSVVAIFALVTLQACATTEQALASKHDGTSQVYDISPDQAWSVATAVLHWENAEDIVENKGSRYLTAIITSSAFSMGAVVAVWVDPFGKEYVKVTVVTKRRLQTNFATGLTESTFHKRFSQAADIIKSGKPLPTRPPRD